MDECCVPVRDDVSCVRVTSEIPSERPAPHVAQVKEMPAPPLQALPNSEQQYDDYLTKGLPSQVATAPFRDVSGYAIVLAC